MARRNASGDTEARPVFGLLLPRGAVTPHATLPPPTECTPVTIALQMRA